MANKFLIRESGFLKYSLNKLEKLPRDLKKNCSCIEQSQVVF